MPVTTRERAHSHSAALASNENTTVPDAPARRRRENVYEFNVQPFPPIRESPLGHLPEELTNMHGKLEVCLEYMVKHRTRKEVVEVLSSLGERLMACKEEADHVMLDRNRVVHDHDEAVEELIKKQNAIDDAMQAECERDVVPKFVRNKISTILEPRFECYVDVCVGDLLAAYFPQSGSFEIAVQYKVQKEYESRSGEIIKDKSSTSQAYLPLVVDRIHEVYAANMTGYENRLKWAREELKKMYDGSSAPTDAQGAAGHSASFDEGSPSFFHSTPRKGRPSSAQFSPPRFNSQAPPVEQPAIPMAYSSHETSTDEVEELQDSMLAVPQGSLGVNLDWSLTFDASTSSGLPDTSRDISCYDVSDTSFMDLAVRAELSFDPLLGHAVAPRRDGRTRYRIPDLMVLLAGEDGLPSDVLLIVENKIRDDPLPQLELYIQLFPPSLDILGLGCRLRNGTGPGLEFMLVRKDFTLPSYPVHYIGGQPWHDANSLFVHKTLKELADRTRRTPVYGKLSEYFPGN